MSATLRTQRHELANKALRALQCWSKCVAGSEASAIYLALARSYLNQAAGFSRRLDFERERLDSVNAMLSAYPHRECRI